MNDDAKTPPVPIANGHLVTEAFGRWPTFHDGELAALAFSRSEREITIDLTLESPWWGRTIRVGLRFEECAERPETEIVGFGWQNVIWEIAWTHDGEWIVAEFRSVASDWGTDGKIRCRRASVLGVEDLGESG